MKIYYSIFIVLFLLTSCKKTEIDVDPVANDILDESSFEDPRDKQQYKTVLIGNQEWMIENLRYRNKLGSIDGCWSYGELKVDTTQVVIDKEAFRQGVLKKFPTITKFGDVYMWPWMVISDSFISSRGDHYTRSWLAFKTNVYNPYYGSVAAYKPLTEALDSIALSLNELALIKTLNAAVKHESLSKHGYLYEYRALKKAVPEGWRLPSDEDFIQLEKYLSIEDKDLFKNEEWRSSVSHFRNKLVENNGFGGTIIFGINNQTTPFRNEGFRSYYWTSTAVDAENLESDVMIRAFQANEQKIYRGTNTVIKVANSVICVRDRN